jgi:methyl-accepting chemotaxis protein
MSEQATMIATGAEEFSTSIQGITASTSSAVTDTAKAAAAADDANVRISKLSESSAQIEDVSKLISSIAAQTNLLALNATIEAARAGEAGRGFAIVAGEVKTLAGRTTEATEQITSAIRAIQSDSTNVTASIAQIVNVIGRIETVQTTIASAVEEQSATAAEMSLSIAAVASVAQSSLEAVNDLQLVSEDMLSKSRELHQRL